MLGFCQPVLDIVFCAGVLEGMSPDELRAAIGLVSAVITRTVG
jgi:hypothetical protein